MGRFSTTVQIKNNTDRMIFVNTFCDIMKKRGFTPCFEDEAAQSYLFAFGEGWVTLANEGYKDNPKKAYDDTREMSEALKTSAFSVEVVDSDFAVLTLNNGDSVIVGDGSGYGIEETSRGNRKDWEPLLAAGKTWEQFSEMCLSEETFVEDTLCEAAEILGIDSYYICANFDEVMEKADGGSGVVAFYFKEAVEKAMSLNAAFVKVFGEALEPLGFKLIKSKYPYFVKVVSDEIIHYVTIANETADGRGDYGVKYKCFDVYCGVSTVYSGSIDFNKNHFKFGSSDFIDSISRIYAEAHRLDLDWGNCMSISPFYYNPTADTYLISAMEKALSATKIYALPVIEQVVTLEKCADYFRIMNHFILPVLSDSGESLLCTKLFSADEYVMFMDRSREREIKECRRELDLNPSLSPKRRNSLETRIKFIMEGREEAKKKDYEMFINPELLEKSPAELERRKAQNTEVLRSYGLDI